MPVGHEAVVHFWSSVFLHFLSTMTGLVYHRDALVVLNYWSIALRIMPMHITSPDFLD